MNKKQKMNKKMAKRAKAKMNKHTPPTIKKYVSKAERAAEAALAAQTNASEPTATVEHSEPTAADA